MSSFSCRSHCGACCIAPSIEAPYYGMPNGKPAGVPCVHLDEVSKQCAIWGTEHYPQTCRDFAAEHSVCRDSAEEALKVISHMEIETLPSKKLK